MERIVTASYDNNNFKALIITSEQTERDLIASVLENEKYDVTTAGHAKEAHERLEHETFDLVISGLAFTAESESDFLSVVRKRFPETYTLLVTDCESADELRQAMQSAGGEIIPRPVLPDVVLARVRRIVKERQMQQELMALRQHIAMNYGFDNIVGISRHIEQLKETARRIAPTDITVLITGPAGSGKELFARAIHHHSTRRNDPFVAIDCSTIPEALVESELFGSAEGAGDNPNGGRKGLLEAADGGTVFLDEVSNIPKSVHSNLVRFLQTSEVRDSDSGKWKKVSVRIIAASGRDLGEMAAARAFPEDLYLRLNVIPLQIPSLLRRAEDIEILTEYFLRRISRNAGSPMLTISNQAIDKLHGYSWPGNVRELENTLKRAAALCTHNHLDAEDIVFIGSGGISETQQTGTTRRLTLKGHLLDDGQRSLILKALDDNNWNYTRTAEDLGIGRTTLWRKIKKYNLSRETAGSTS
jgi:DNA-binding NtrC family response regulator